MKLLEELVLQTLHFTCIRSIRQLTSALSLELVLQALHLTVLGAGVLERMRLLLLEL